MRKIIIDVDTGVDDAIGLMLAGLTPNIDVLGILTVCGNISLDKAYLNTRRVLKMLGREDIKVYKGADRPLVREVIDAGGIHGVDGLNGQLADIQLKPETLVSGIDFLIDQIKSNPHQIELAVTGPITNLAIALKKSPEIVGLLKSVHVMTGAFEVIGNVTPVAEFNAFADPDALKIVLDSGIENLYLYGLDVTKLTLLTASSLKQIENETYRKFLTDLTDNYMILYTEYLGKEGCAMHDPLVVGNMINPGFIDFVHTYVTIDLESELCYGKTIADTKNFYKQTPNAYVATVVRNEAFIKFMTDTLGVK